MRALTELERLGYTFTLDNNTIRYRLAGTHPDPEIVQPLLAELKAHKPEAISFLQARALPEHIAILDWLALPIELAQLYVFD